LLESDRLSAVVRRLCRRGLGVGADGVLFAEAPQPGNGADVRARFMEPDGTEAELCGNGTACFVYWALREGLISGSEVTVATGAGHARAQLHPEYPDRVRVCIPDPGEIRLNRELDVKGETWPLHSLVNGVPHAVAFVEDLETLDVQHWGPGIRWHSEFAPRGINANFAQVLSEGHLAVRTYEFGVEGETLACGTGAAAAAIVASLVFEWDEAYRLGEQPVHVDVRGGETLRVWFVVRRDTEVTDVCLETRVCDVYEGRIRPQFARRMADTLAPQP
jgi:diaminopimelate epimerase